MAEGSGAQVQEPPPTERLVASPEASRTGKPTQATPECSGSGGDTVGVGRGEPLPLGLHECRDGSNLAVFSRHATSMTLLLFETAGDIEPSTSIALDAPHHRTGDIWHARLTGDLRGKFYALQADGPHSPAEGRAFDADRALLDPYAGSVTGLASRRGSATAETGSRSPPRLGGRCVIVDRAFNWGAATR
jgi:isoamylase